MEENENEEAAPVVANEENVTKVSMKSMVQEPEIHKVDFSNPPEVTPEPEAVKEDENQTDLEEIIEEVTQEEVTTDEVPTLEEVTDADNAEQVVEIVTQPPVPVESGVPDNIKKLLTFMDDTGGDINDYVKLNRDTDSLDNQDALSEYYRETKPHLSAEEINFMIEDQFSYDESLDEEVVIKRKKLAQKEQVASAKAYLDGQKSKYYEEIKAGSKLTVEQQEAINFYDKHTKDSEENHKATQNQKATFTQKTDQVFNNNFKGFDFNVGDKNFRYNVKDVEGIKENQSDINNFIGKFLDDSNSISDAKGYHKSLFTAMNPDAVAKHFYDQGKADALKSSVAKAKNINTNPRQSHGEVSAGGIKYRVLGNDANEFKVKIKNKR
jgi:hypothetical protein